MEKEFIPYEQSLELKELGFDELCLGFYIKDKPKLRLGEGTNLVTRYERENVMEYPLFNTNFHYGMNKPYFSYLLTTAPLWQQAFDWFREKHGLFTQDFIDLDNKFTKNIVKVLKNGQEFTYLDYYNSYQETRLECLKKLIEIVKEFKKK